MRRITAYISIFVSLLFLTACNDTKPFEAFSLRDDICLEINGSDCFVFDPYTCQLSSSRDLRSFRAGTDTMSDYYEVTLSSIPTFTGDIVEGYVCWTTESGVSAKNNITLEAIRREGDKVWLWNDQTRLGVVVEFFD